MSIGVLQRLINGLLNTKLRQIKILWHGGEPLLAGFDFYRHAVSFQKSAVEKCSYLPSLSNTIQTNGTLPNKGLIQFLVKEQFHFGVSLDGPANIHDANRRTKSGKGTHATILKTLNLLRSLGAEVGIVAVITRFSLPYAESIFNFFVSNSLKNIHFLPFAEFNHQAKTIDERSITDRQFGDFVVQIFHLWSKLDDLSVKIRIIDNFIQGLLGGHMELCTFKNDCQTHIVVESRGDLYICGRNANNSRYFIGNICLMDVEEILASHLMEGISMEMRRVPKTCEECKWFHVCRGGCSYYKLLYSEGFELQTEYFCGGYKMLLKEIEAWMKYQGVSFDSYNDRHTHILNNE